VKDREKVRHRLASASLSVLDAAERDLRLRHLARLMDQMPEAPTAQTARPPHPNRGVSRGLDIVSAEIDSRESHTVLNLNPKARTADHSDTNRSAGSADSNPRSTKRHPS
jgi:hypothetical protein